jgi:hypothetical protein
MAHLKISKRDTKTLNSVCYKIMNYIDTMKFNTLKSLLFVGHEFS